jgi:hypothetical protein
MSQTLKVWLQLLALLTVMFALGGAVFLARRHGMIAG